MTRRFGRLKVLALVAVSVGTIRLGAQALTVDRRGDVVAVHAPGLGFIKGEWLARLKDGRTLRVDIELSVLPRPGGGPVARDRRTFVLSYDLWEERFAVTMAGTPPRAAAYLTAPGAEAWCVEQLTVPVAALGRLGRDAPFWVRLEYRVLDSDAGPAADDAGFTLRGLIDAFSRRPRPSAWEHAEEAGPFRLR